MDARRFRTNVGTVAARTEPAIATATAASIGVRERMRASSVALCTSERSEPALSEAKRAGVLGE